MGLLTFVLPETMGKTMMYTMEEFVERYQTKQKDKTLKFKNKS